MNKRELRAQMVKHGDTQLSLSKAMGIGLSTLNAKINSANTEFRQNEISFIKERYDLTAQQVNAIFFGQ